MATSKLTAILDARCPRCRVGPMFQYPLLKVSKFSKMHKHCPHCGFRFEIEPDFFAGAMYVSYAMSVGLFITVFVVMLVVFNDPPLWVYITTVAVANVFLIPVFFRYSRVLYLHLFGGVRYRPELADQPPVAPPSSSH
ncbi:Protein of unknown function [Catalinimonas alkaloidigena]|uniref:DUF983 domain-containing protein n=1 Tax=Catalinimonas alkaloidigena TaxID=1075417 RepID=A0A1G9LRZ4_9BACT|nr:DUF983 domain-containing protein [Catalinimonas alkaloidigena]SDL64673.1 Protein of unknown function [Catalinimonas alkaloidigena]